MSEGGVIVASILLAFGIDAWWDRTRDVRLEEVALAAVVGEIDVNRGFLREAIAQHESQLSSTQAFLAWSGQGALGDLEPASVIGALPSADSFNPVLSATRLFSDMPVRSRASWAAQTQVAHSVSLWEEAAEEHDVLSDLRAKVRTNLARHANEDSSQFPYISGMVADQGPGILQLLRADDELVQSVLEKSHIQMAYVLSLRSLLEHWDSMSVQLRADQLQ